MISFQISDNCRVLSDSHLELHGGSAYFMNCVGCQLLVTFLRTLNGVEVGGAGAGRGAHSLPPRLSFTSISAPAGCFHLTALRRVGKAEQERADVLQRARGRLA